MKETTYNKYKRQNEEMKSFLSVDIKRFLLDQDDVLERISYIQKCILLYRKNKQDTSNAKSEGGKK